MSSKGLIRPQGSLEPARSGGTTLMQKVSELQGRHLKLKGRRQANVGERENLWHTAGRSVGVMGGAFIVGAFQGRFGTSRLGGWLPGELLGAGVLHLVATHSMVPRPLKVALRAVADGGLAAAAQTAGFAFGEKSRKPAARPAAAAAPAGAPATPGVSGYGPQTGGAALSDEELARFANRT
jgi:hypothetical protein